jgi:hypothetical protein
MAGCLVKRTATHCGPFHFVLLGVIDDADANSASDAADGRPRTGAPVAAAVRLRAWPGRLCRMACPQRLWVQISATCVAEARRVICAHDEWLTISDRPGLAVSTSFGRHRSGALRSHGSPRCRAPPRSGLRGGSMPGDATRVRVNRAWPHPVPPGSARARFARVWSAV